MKKYKYVFSKELWKKDMKRLKGLFDFMTWPQECDGIEVHLTGRTGNCLAYGKIYTVFKEWCKKIEIKEK